MTGRKNNSPVDYVMPDGTTRTFASINALAEELGMSYRNAYAQVFKHKTRRKHRVQYPDRDGVTREWESIAALARHYDISREAMRLRIKKAENGEKETK